MASKFALNRRTVLRGLLRGAAVSVALPAFEAMLNGHGTALASGAPFPHRFVVWFWGNGVMPDWWEPKTQGPLWEPNIETEPLRAYRDYVGFATGCTVFQPMVEHVAGHTGALTGDGLNGLGARNNADLFYRAIASSPSIDQLLLPALGASDTMMPLGLQLACELESSGPAANYISHRAVTPGMSAILANLPTKDPGVAFDQLFGVDFPGGPSGSGPMRRVNGPAAVRRQGALTAVGGKNTGADVRQRLRQSVLDAVKADAARLKQKLGKTDQLRLESHLEGVRNIERRIAACSNGQGGPISPAMVGDGACSVPMRPGSFANIREQAGLMADLMTYAMACDLTRSIAFQITSAGHQHSMPEVGVTKNLHDTLSHHLSDPGNTQQYQAGIANFMAALADFLGKMKGVREGSETLLDHMALMGTSCTSHPGHDHERWPLLVAGRANGALKYPAVNFKAPAGTSATRFGFTLMKALGYAPNQWGTGASQVSSVFTEMLA